MLVDGANLIRNLEKLQYIVRCATLYSHLRLFSYTTMIPIPTRRQKMRIRYEGRTKTTKQTCPSGLQLKYVDESSRRC